MHTFYLDLHNKIGLGHLGGWYDVHTGVLSNAGYILVRSRCQGNGKDLVERYVAGGAGEGLRSEAWLYQEMGHIPGNGSVSQ